MSYESDMKALLSEFRKGTMSDEELLEKLQDLNVTDLGFAKLDHNRSIRQGFPEVVYCEGKTIAQAATILKTLAGRHANVLGTRAGRDLYEAVQKDLPDAVYHEDARLIVLEREPLPKDDKRVIAVVAAGTSDFPVSEEAALTAEVMGNKVVRVYDVGVAGIHRLLGKIDVIRAANVVVVVAGMEGALASVVGGLVNKPVIAVPTSVGYGANFHGLSALLGMLNSCSAGVAVVNIDNGFGAGRMASIINHLR
ncbi:MAG: nickel pincer cofactor biosynthesis protein LarB [Succiniclasticum sp.]|nr:nickel pincer cofactor biosynthesis protein LarB [Succiniclasticum sp.]MEE3479637.1 nickel pincer cofactor biosynthesis protein LarB [Succiniclasticum sp.]